MYFCHPLLSDFDGLSPYILNKFFNLTYGKEISTNYGELMELEHIHLYKNVVYVDFTPCQQVRDEIEKYLKRTNDRSEIGSKRPPINQRTTRRIKK